VFARKDLGLKWLEIAGQARNDDNRRGRNDEGRGNDKGAMTAEAGGGGSRAPALQWRDRPPL